MLHAYVTRFDVIENLNFFATFLELNKAIDSKNQFLEVSGFCFASITGSLWILQCPLLRLGDHLVLECFLPAAIANHCALYTLVVQVIIMQPSHLLVHVPSFCTH